jgi:hypothetical protein
MSSLRKVPQPDGRRSAKSSRAFSALVPWLTTEIATLDPSCFALVMATGIISNAFFFAGVRAWSDALFVVNLVALLWLILITALRALAFRPALWADLIDPRKVFGFFTIIAGVDVFGAALALRSLPALALALWLAALVLWVLLIYFSFGVLIFLNTARGANIVHGGDFQSMRDRSAVYGYLHMVFMQVDWWAQKPDEMREALQTIKIETPNIKLPDDMYAAVIMLTADPKKVDGKTRQQVVASVAVRSRIQARERAAHGLSSAQGWHQQVRVEIHPSPRAKQQGESREISVDRIVSVIRNVDQRWAKSKAARLTVR